MKKDEDPFIGGRDRGNIYLSLSKSSPMHPALSNLIQEQVGHKIFRVALIGVLFALFSLIIDGGFGMAVLGFVCALIAAVTTDGMMTNSVTIGHGEIMGRLYQRVLSCQGDILAIHESRLLNLAKNRLVTHNWGFPVHEGARSAVSQEVTKILEHWPALKSLREEFDSLENPALVDRQYGGRMWDVWALWHDALNAEVTVAVLRRLQSQADQKMGEPT